MDDPSRYHWYGEEPFPWLLFAIYCVPIALILFAVTLGIVLAC